MFGAWYESHHPKFFLENEMLSYIQMGTFIVECISDVSKEGGQNQKKIVGKELENTTTFYWIPFMATDFRVFITDDYRSVCTLSVLRP